MTPTNGADEVDPIPDEGKNLTSIAAIPQLLAEYSKDNFHPPESVSSKARSEFKWECKEGHSWFQSPYYRTLDGIVRECGYCTKEWPDFEKSFYETHPLHAYFWDQDENKGLKPWMVTAEDTVWVNFKCIRCGCKWAESLATFALIDHSIELCPDCRTKNASFLELKPEFPLVLKPFEVWVLCPNNHFYRFMVDDFVTDAISCPKCHKKIDISFAKSR